MKRISTSFFALLLLLLGNVLAQPMPTVSGTVTDTVTNQPLAGVIVIVSVLHQNRPPQLFTTFSDSNGNYAVGRILNPDTAQVKIGWLNCTGGIDSVDLGRTPLPTSYNILTCGRNQVPTGCLARFSARRVPFNPLLVDFAAVGHNPSNARYQWDFGDGNTGTGAHAPHTYAQPDTYQVCLIVSTPTCSDTFCRPVIVGSVHPTPCIARFFTLPDSGQNAFRFLPIVRNYASYDWDFGDGTTASGAPVSHTYAQAGTYRVCLIVTDSAGTCSDTFCQPLTVVQPRPCHARFSYAPDPVAFPLQYVFRAANRTTSARYQWDFGDGNTGTGATVSHRYGNVADTFRVCLIVTTPTCSDTMCKVIFWPGLGGGGSNCQSLFTINQSPLAVVPPIYVFTAQNNNQRAQFVWNFGDGNIDTGRVVGHQYQQPGNYRVCLITRTASCVDTTCRIFTAQFNNSPCLARFSTQASATNPLQMEFSAVANTNNTRFQWDFGDGSTGTGLRTQHTYAQPDTYRVCLIVTTPTCSDTFCRPVIVRGNRPPNQVLIAGMIRKNNQPADHYRVFLIEYDSVAGTLTAVDTFESISSPILLPGTYFFQAPRGRYLVKAALTRRDADYRAFMPTYYVNALRWPSAVEVPGRNNPGFNTDITLIAGRNPGGPGFVGGLVSQGANKDEGDPIEGMHIVLLDANGQSVAHSETDANGEFELEDLPYGTYQLVVEMWGKAMEPYWVTLGPNSQSIENLRFEVHSETIDAVETRSVDVQLAQELQLRMYPNPARNQVQMRFENPQTASLEWQLIDLTGRTLRQGAETLGSGSQTVKFSVETLPEGAYFLRAQYDGRQLPAQKLIVE